MLKPIKDERLFNIKVLYTKTCFGQKFINYLGTNSFKCSLSWIVYMQYRNKIRIPIISEKN